MTDVSASTPPASQVLPRAPWTDRLRTGAFVLSSRAQVVLVFGVYLLFALVITWPWVLHPQSTLYGVTGGDLTSDVALFQQYANARHPPFLPGRLPQFNAPEGLPITWPLYLAGVGSSAVLWSLSVAVGSVAAHGLIAVLGFALSALSMFLLVRYVTGHAGVGFAVGLAFGFWPYMYGTGWTWPHYIHIWVFVLLTWRMLVVAERPTPLNGLWAALAGVLAMTWIQYNLLLAGVLFVTLSGVVLFRSATERRFLAQLRAQAIAVGIVVLALGGILVAARSNGVSGLVPTRPTADTFANSARPLMYVVPGPQHPIFGALTGPWLSHRYPGSAGNSLNLTDYSDIYMGIPLLALAGLGAFWTLGGLRRPSARLGGRRNAVGLTALVVGAVALAFSFPPQLRILGVDLPMPYEVVGQFTTTFRAASRFAVIVMLAVCVLAGLALARLVSGRPRHIQWAMLALASVIFAVDLAAPPRPRTTRTHEAPIYKQLAKQPPGIVAEYPFEGPAVALNKQALRPDMSEHPSFTGYDDGTASGSRKQELQYLAAPRTVPDLAAYGVRYVIADRGAVPPRTPAGLERIAEARRAVLYRVTAQPARFVSYADTGFNATEGQSPGVRWMSEEGAQLELWGSCSPCDGTISFGSGAFAHERTLAIYDTVGRLLFNQVIASASVPVAFHIRFVGSTSLTFYTDPPPTEVNRVLGGDDTRRFAIFVAQPVRFVQDGSNRWVGAGVRMTATFFGSAR